MIDSKMSDPPTPSCALSCRNCYGLRFNLSDSGVTASWSPSMTHAYFILFDHYVLKHDASWSIDLGFCSGSEPEGVVEKVPDHLFAPTPFSGTVKRPGGWVLLYLHPHPVVKDAKVISIYTVANSIGEEKQIEKVLAPFLRRYTLTGLQLTPMSESIVSGKGKLYFAIETRMGSRPSSNTSKAADCCITAFEIATESFGFDEADLWCSEFQKLTKKHRCFGGVPDVPHVRMCWLHCLFKAFIVAAEEERDE